MYLNVARAKMQQVFFCTKNNNNNINPLYAITSDFCSSLNGINTAYVTTMITKYWQVGIDNSTEQA